MEYLLNVYVGYRLEATRCNLPPRQLQTQCKLQEQCTPELWGSSIVRFGKIILSDLGQTDLSANRPQGYQKVIKSNRFDFGVLTTVPRFSQHDKPKGDQKESNRVSMHFGVRCLNIYVGAPPGALRMQHLQTERSSQQKNSCASRASKVRDIRRGGTIIIHIHNPIHRGNVRLSQTENG